MPAQEAGKLVQLDEEVSVRIARTYIKSTGIRGMPPGCSRLLIETPSGFQIIAPEPLGKLNKSYDTSPPGKQSGEGAPCYEEHHAMQEITV